MIKVYDNKGQTLDRYTVIINDDVFTMSSDPLWPQEVNQWLGTADEIDKDKLGIPISLKQLPEEVLIAILYRLCDEIRIYDNGCIYTMVADNEVYLMSACPQSPYGINICLGRDIYNEDAGRPVTLKDLPKSVLIGIIYRLLEKGGENVR